MSASTEALADAADDLDLWLRGGEHRRLTVSGTARGYTAEAYTGARPEAWGEGRALADALAALALALAGSA